MTPRPRSRPETLFDYKAFADYIDAFNRDDFKAYGRHYAPDIRMNYGGRVLLEGRDAIERFYASLHQRVTQSIRALNAAHGDNVIFADVEGKFVALEDFSDFSLGPLRRGEHMLSRSLVRYDLNAGLITAVTSARYSLESPRGLRRPAAP